MMVNELDVFGKLSWKDKIEYMIGFYQGMLKKTDNPDYISIFENKIEEIQGYNENENNEKKLINLYEKIISAKEKTKQRKIEETTKNIEDQKKKLAKLESDEFEQDPDEFLAEAMAKI